MIQPDSLEHVSDSLTAVSHYLDSVQLHVQNLTFKVDQLQTTQHDIIDGYQRLITIFVTAVSFFLGLKWYTDRQTINKKIKDAQSELLNSNEKLIHSFLETQSKSLAEFETKLNSRINNLPVSSVKDEIESVLKLTKFIENRLNLFEINLVRLRYNKGLTSNYYYGSDFEIHYGFLKLAFQLYKTDKFEVGLLNSYLDELINYLQPLNDLSLKLVIEKRDEVIKMINGLLVFNGFTDKVEHLITLIKQKVNP